MKSYIRKVNYYETDQMGIVHHSNYIRYFEEARVFFMDQAGYPYERLESESIMSPVIGVSCRYHKPVRFGDTICINVSMTKMSRLKCSFAYEIVDGSTGERRADGTSEHGFIDINGWPVNLPKEKPEFYSAMLAELEPQKPQE